MITRTSLSSTEATRREINDNAETRSSVDSVFGKDPPTGPRPILLQNFYRSAPVRVVARPEENLQPVFLEKDAREFTTLHFLDVDTKPKYYEIGSLSYSRVGQIPVDLVVPRSLKGLWIQKAKQSFD